MDAGLFKVTGEWGVAEQQGAFFRTVSAVP
jgi:hypothetical protein